MVKSATTGVSTAACVLALLAGCAPASLTAPAPGSLEILPKEAGIAVLPARVVRTVPKDGMANARLKLRVQEAIQTAPHFQVLALPATWTDAFVTLFSPTANSVFDPTKHSLTILEPAFSAPVGGARTATASFPPLRPATDYTGRVFLRNQAGTISTLRLAGSSLLSAITLNAGANPLDFTVTINSVEGTYDVAGPTSTGGNVTTGNMITKDDTVTLDTGVLASQPGVDHVDIYISGPAYGSPGSPVLIKRFIAADAATWNTFSWDTSANNSADTAAYVAATFVGGANQATKAGQLDVQAYNSDSQLVGKASFSINVFGRPTTTITVR